MSKNLVNSQHVPASLCDSSTFLTEFADWLRLNVAEGDARPNTVRTYETQARQFVGCCVEQRISSAKASGEDVKGYRRHLVDWLEVRASVAKGGMAALFVVVGP